VPVTVELKAILEAAPRVSPVIVTTEEGRPYTSDGFRAIWRKTCHRAGIEGLTFHDLRRGCTRLAFAGATVPEIATFTGHSVSDWNTILDRIISIGIEL
jgi:integrase